MKQGKNTSKKWTVLAIVANAVLIVCVVFSVISAFANAEEVSLAQNVENVLTLTNASANKVELVTLHHSNEVKKVANYISNYDGKGMNADEVNQYFSQFYSLEDATLGSWQVADCVDNGEKGSNYGFQAITLDEQQSSLTYRVQTYPELAKIFASANENTMGEIHYTSEFMDPSPILAKSFAITTTIRIREDEGYQYKTLMLVLESSYITNLISNNNDIDTLSYYDYSNIIINNDGEYVISDSHFQGTNFFDYISLYDDKFTDNEREGLKEGLTTENYSNVIFYKNNREQDCVYSIVPIQNSEWHILSVVPIASFKNTTEFGSNFAMFSVFFGLLFAVDILFVLHVNRELRRKTLEAQSANEAKTQFLSSMSHDIRTPMNAIIGMTVLAEDNLEEEHPDVETLKDYIDTIKTSGNHLITLINDILDISKIENGKVVLAADDFCISSSIEKMIQIIQPQLKTKTLKFETHIINVTHEYVCSDELRINQIYINILSNAIKYTKSGGEICVDFREEPIPNCTDKARFVFSVADTGIGMDPEFLKTIFNRFTRAVDSRVNSTQGTGLGMAISKQLVDLLGGTIEVESQVNVGSKFTVTLDLPIAEAPDESISLNGITTLLIDDDPFLLETTKTSLEKEGMIVDVANDGAKGTQMALEAKQNNKPYGVILVDWKMMPMSGVEVIRQLHNQLEGASKLVVMTAYNISDIERDARNAGADAFISKPLFRSRLLQTVQYLFSEEGVKMKSFKNDEKFDLSVLVAEDNRVNWKVLSRILNKFGIEADHAENGEIAVEMVQKGTYDLVLMDIQMPVLDGYGATIKIRQLEDPIQSKIPIYAMTADTFAEDVAKCIETGMNGHLAKPIEIDRLEKVLSIVDEQKHPHPIS